jgi:hypothetical protein
VPKDSTAQHAKNMPALFVPALVSPIRQFVVLRSELATPTDLVSSFFPSGVFKKNSGIGITDIAKMFRG